MKLFLNQPERNNEWKNKKIYCQGITSHITATSLGGFGSAYSANDFPPHNFLLFVLCDYGWIAAILLIVVLLKFGFKYYRFASLKRDDLFVILLLSTLILFPVLSSVSSTNEQRKIIWIVLGIFMNQYLCCRKTYDKEAPVLRKMKGSMS